MTISDSYKTVEITKTVPVVDRETLEAFLNERLKDFTSVPTKIDTGSKALELIEEAGFTLTPPTVKR